MIYLTEGTITVLLLFITYQDVRYRAVYWVCFPLLATLLVTYQAASHHTGILGNVLQNIGFLLLNLLVLGGYFRARHVGLRAIFSQFLGLGDVLFFGCLCFLFSPDRFIFFYLTSLLLTLGGCATLRLVQRPEKSIPLAGIQALLLGCLFGAQCLLPQLNLFYTFPAL